MYDVIIVGASFAGLAVANQLRGYHTLLIDRKLPGTGQTSACGTILQVLRYWGLLDTIKQTHDQIRLHTPRGDYTFPSQYPWCTFDYQYFCEALYERSQAEFLQAVVQGTQGEIVYTSLGELRASCIVDASGWRSVLTGSLSPVSEKTRKMNFGIETIVQAPEDHGFDSNSLHFWYDPDILSRGVGWIFPRGKTASLGVASYSGATHLKNSLDRLGARFDLDSGGLHGTYFPYALRSTKFGRVFVVGDAAGMCIGLTGEGIRPALFFGEACGRIIHRFLEGAITIQGALEEYTAFVNKHRPFFLIFSTLQGLLIRLPVKWIDEIAVFIGHEPILHWTLDQYWSLTAAWDNL
jgi:flavin-dependent dehydrogenase